MNFSIIGGGPVGLFASILLAKEGHNVTIYEKREKYIRQQVLLIHPNILPDYIQKKIVGKNKPGCFASLPPSITQPQCSIYNTKNTNFISITTSVLENILTKISKKNKVKIINKEISLKDIHKLKKKSDFVLISSGKNEEFIKSISATYINKKNIYNGLGVVFETKEDFSSSVPLLEHAQHRYRLFATKKNTWYLGVNGSKEDLNLNKDEIIKDAMLFYGIDKYKIKSSFEIDIPIYKSSKYCSDNIFLIGDTGSGVHFFSGSGVNTGFTGVWIFLESILHKNPCVYFKKHITQLISETRKKMKPVFHEDTVLDRLCAKYDVEELYEMLEEKNFPKRTELLNSNEICYLLGKNALN
jgi:flavin-dependent dehydrogenase